MAEVIVGIKQEPIEAETVELVDVDYENQEKTDENIPQKRKRGRPLKTTKLLTEDEAETAAQVESLFPTGRPKRNVTPRVNSDYVYSSLGRAASPSKDQDKSNKKPVDNGGKRKLKMEDLTALATTADEDGNEVLYEIHISDLEQMQMVQDGQTILEVVDPEKAQEVFVGASAEEVGEPSSNALHSTENEEAYADVEMKQEPQLQDDDDQDYPHGYQPTNEKKRKKVYMKDPSDPMRRFTCPYVGCSYVAKYRSNLWDHKKTHTGEKPYHCTWPDCEMRFSQTHQLKLHLRSHTGERPYKCTWPGCDASFSQKPGLRSHVLTHTGEKDFKCDFPGCNWSFRLKGALTDHKRAVHENAKKFLCEWPGCGKRFLQSCHLKKHLMAHADIKPFACDWPKCTYKAVTMAYVTNHRRTHTGERNHECPFPGCHKRFVKSSHLNRHRQRCHAGIVRLNQDGEYVDDEEIYQDEENEEVFEEREEVQELGDSNEILIEFSDQVDDIIVSVNGTKRIIKGQLVEDKDGSQYIATIDPETGESITTPMEDILQLKSEPVVSYEDIEIKTEVQ